jgi:hypothetical protein
MFERDPALESARFASVWPFLGHVDVEDRLDPLESDVCLRNRIGHLGQVLHRLEEFRKIREKDRQRSNGHRSCKDEARSPPEDQGRA